MISASDLRDAAEAIRRGELVAFPTETVYGLGAHALDAAAVARIYEAKGRPAASPLIVHVASLEQARDLAAEWPEPAQALARAFWPGPLTLVVPKNSVIPDIVTAGLSTAAFRMPAHEVALALLREAAVPIAAPSANRFTALSPTTAEHVRKSLGDRVRWILDGGPTAIGIESTVVAITRGGVHLLRPGSVTTRQLEAVVGSLRPPPESESASHASPGLHRRHYRPRTPLYLGTPVDPGRSGRGAYLYLSVPAPGARPIQMPLDAQTYAARLYAVLHDVDSQGFDWIGVEPPPNTPEWDGVRDRLTRASAGSEN